MRHQSEIIISQTCNLNHHPQIGFTTFIRHHPAQRTSGRYLLLCRPDDFMMLGESPPSRRIWTWGNPQSPRSQWENHWTSSRNGEFPSCFHVSMFTRVPWNWAKDVSWFLIKCLEKKDGWIGSSEQSFLGEPFRVYPYRITTFWLVVTIGGVKHSKCIKVLFMFILHIGMMTARSLMMIRCDDMRCLEWVAQLPALPAKDITSPFPHFNGSSQSNS